MHLLRLMPDCHDLPSPDDPGTVSARSPHPGRVGVIVLGAATLLLLIGLNLWEPQVAGHPLHEAELQIPMHQLRSTERLPLGRWLLVDSLFACTYTAFFFVLLHGLADRASSVGLSRAGRVLAGLVLLGLGVDLAENLILWATAITAAPQVAGVLRLLVPGKFVSALLTLSYVVAFGGARWWARVSAQSR